VHGQARHRRARAAWCGIGEADWHGMIMTFAAAPAARRAPLIGIGAGVAARRPNEDASRRGSFDHG